MIRLRLLTLVLVASGLARPADAGPISLFNTGVNASGTILAGGSSDPHWTIVSGTGINTPQAAVVVNDQSGLGLYTQDSISRWIWVNAAGTGAINTRTTFA